MERIRIEISDGRKPTIQEIIYARTSLDTHSDWDHLVIDKADKTDLRAADEIMGRNRNWNLSIIDRREGFDDR